jgi:hypothetical protein
MPTSALEAEPELDDTLVRRSIERVFEGDTVGPWLIRAPSSGPRQLGTQLLAVTDSLRDATTATH